MPAWLWRDWLGPPAWRGPRWLLGRRPRRRLLPPPPEGLPDPDPCPAGPAFIVLSKPARSGFPARYRIPKITLSGSPLVAAGSYSVGAQPLIHFIEELGNLVIG